MAKIKKAILIKNKANGQFNISLSKKRIPKSFLKDLKNAKKVDIDITKLYPT